MKKIVFFIVITFVYQMFCENIMGQQIERKDQYVLSQTQSGISVGAFQYKSFNNKYEAQLVSWGTDIPISFGFGETNQTIGLQMLNGRNNDFTLYFPISNASNSKWNRIVAKNNLSFTTSDRGLTADVSDFFIHTSGNVGIGFSTPSEKLSVYGNIKLENNGKLIGTNELELASNAFGFTLGGIKGLQMLNGRNSDFTLYFPVSNASNSGWSRIIAKNNLSFTAGDRGLTTDVSDFFIHTSGNIGIGLSTPSSVLSEKLSVYGNIKIENGEKFILQNNSNSLGFEINSKWAGGGTVDKQYYLGLATTTNHGLILGANKRAIMDVMPNGGKGYVIIYKDGIGSSPSEIKQAYRDKYALFVENGILSEDFAIGPQKTWADYVFNVDYKLKTLNEIEQFVQENKHLPDMPAASEVHENGYNLHDMTVKLLQKVEELTLYSIEQNKKIEQLEDVVKSYQILLEKIEKLESKVNR
jgi:hypothetical protein